MKKKYVSPEIVVCPIDKDIMIMMGSGNNMPGNSGNAPGHNKDDNGKPTKPGHGKGINEYNPFDNNNSIFN